MKEIDKSKLNTDKCSCYVLSKVLDPDFDFSQIDHICRFTMQHACYNWAQPQIERVRQQERIDTVDRLNEATFLGNAADKCCGDSNKLKKRGSVDIVSSQNRSRIVLQLPDDRLVVAEKEDYWPLRLLDTISVFNRDPYDGRGIVLVIRQYVKELHRAHRQSRLERTDLLTGEEAKEMWRKEWGAIERRFGLTIPDGITPPYEKRAHDTLTNGLPPQPMYGDYLKSGKAGTGSGLVTSFVEITLGSNTKVRKSPGFILNSVQFYTPFTDAYSQREALKTIGKHQDFIQKVGEKAEQPIDLWPVECRPGPKRSKARVTAQELANSSTPDKDAREQLRKAEFDRRKDQNTERQALGKKPIPVDPSSVKAAANKQYYRGKKDRNN